MSRKTSKKNKEKLLIPDTRDKLINKHKRQTRRDNDEFSKYKSGLEVAVAKELLSKGIQFSYESLKLPYTINYHYVPDFVLPNGIIVETKGFFRAEDKRKMKVVKITYPEADIRLLFSSKCSKGQREKYSAWCEKIGYQYAFGDKVPHDWLLEE